MALGVALRLAHAGYWGGDPGKILRQPADQVVAASQYEDFLADAERATYDLNKERA